jgi:cysteine desulfuration protein SufE
MSVHWQEWVEAFQMFPDWEDRYRMIEDLGRHLPPFPQAWRSEANRIQDCHTQAWLVVQPSATEEGAPVTLHWLADAETVTVRGLMALGLLPFRDKTPAEVLATDPLTFLAPLGLEAALSPNRRAGLEALFLRIRQLALDHSHTA